MSCRHGHQPRRWREGFVVSCNTMDELLALLNAHVLAADLYDNEQRRLGDSGIPRLTNGGGEICRSGPSIMEAEGSQKSAYRGYKCLTASVKRSSRRDFSRDPDRQYPFWCCRAVRSRRRSLSLRLRRTTSLLWVQPHTICLDMTHKIAAVLALEKPRYQNRSVQLFVR